MISLKSSLACRKTVSVVMVMVGIMMMNGVNAASNCTSWCGTSSHLDTNVGELTSEPVTAYYFYNQSFPPNVFLTSSNIRCPVQFSFFNNFQALIINGIVENPSESSSGFIFEFQFRSESNYNPNLDLQSSAYVQNGGIVDPTTFSFWTLTEGTVSGYGSYRGASLSMTEFMHPLQVGIGANGKNLNFGAGGWFSYVNANGSIIQTDLNVDLTCAQNNNNNCDAATTCSTHGACNADGSCYCYTGYSGSSCNQCASGYSGYPNCVATCDAATTCSSQGTCNADASCTCNTGYTGSSCNQCASGYSGYPNCVVTCDAATTCSSFGTCNADGSCTCNTGYAGSSCNQCASGYSGYPTCVSTCATISGGIVSPSATSSTATNGANQVYISMGTIAAATVAAVIFA